MKTCQSISQFKSHYLLLEKIVFCSKNNFLFMFLLKYYIIKCSDEILLEITCGFA